MTNNYNQCACSASFPSAELLANHLAEIRSQERYHVIQLEQCRKHLVSDNSDDEQHVEAPRDPEPESKICPFPNCKRTKPFATNFKLWRHAAQHVRCEEVCVICFKLFEFASEIIRHCEENHRTEFGRKATYMKGTLEEVSRRVSSELYAAKIVFKERTLVCSTSESKKRTRDEAGIDNETLETQGAELVALTTQRSQLHATNMSALPPPPTDAAFPLIMTASELNRPRDSDELHNSSTQLMYHHPTQENTVVDPYNARLLQLVSSVPFTGDFDWAEIEGWDGSQNVI
ncbi:hypothetical protein Forpi1262_v007054 [Fusarium oxysporum f. sp. raphani]|uniref:C2H2-type domain-containing protein n=1 Tax=Fusarium oxysporum f. sp. raphani TaxID=96318 RepID=A0A8J5PM73_FUSOX|nr:hypothetical protein Forpi1262_v007054 [Fusarium oxysporum f. sp. raphani]